MTMSFAEILRSYARGLLDKQPWNDLDLAPRERKVTGVLLNLVSNIPVATRDYPPNDDTRDAAVRKLADLAWEFRAITQQLGKSADDTFTVAIERAITIIRSI